MKPPSSRYRALVRDLADALRQQMYFWGCDVRHPSGNLLARFGMERLARPTAEGEGTSRYRMPWRHGVIELHGFCAGWYPPHGSGILYIRGQHALQRCEGGAPLTPGHYESERLQSATREDLLSLARPFIEWVAHYEAWVHTEAGAAHRERCWRALHTLQRGRPWLPPTEARHWLHTFLHTPHATPRPSKSGRKSTREGPIYLRRT